MKSSQLKELIIRGLDNDSDPAEIFAKIKEAGVDYQFSNNFTSKVLDAVFITGSASAPDNELASSIRIINYRLAVAGIAAIVLLALSLFLSEGSFSLNSFLGISNNYDESIFCLLTGN